MSGLLTLHVFANDLSASQSRVLLDWCVARGANAFTVSAVGFPPALELYRDLLDERLARYAVPSTGIPVLPKGQPGAFWTRPERLWILNSDSADILWRELDGLLLGYFTSSSAWLENPTLYRGQELMLGIVSHEQEAVLRIRPDEERLLQLADIPYRLKGKYVGY